MNLSVNKTVETFPRHYVIDSPTPLTCLHRLSEHCDIELCIKRDDLAGLTFGGNKTCQLEYYFDAASAENADTIKNSDV